MANYDTTTSETQFEKNPAIEFTLYGNGIYVRLGANTNIVYCSNDGESWNKKQITLTINNLVFPNTEWHVGSINFMNGTFIMIACVHDTITDTNRKKYMGFHSLYSYDMDNWLYGDFIIKPSTIGDTTTFPKDPNGRRLKPDSCLSYVVYDEDDDIYALLIHNTSANATLSNMTFTYMSTDGTHYKQCDGFITGYVYCFDYGNGVFSGFPAKDLLATNQYDVKPFYGKYNKGNGKLEWFEGVHEPDFICLKYTIYGNGRFLATRVYLSNDVHERNMYFLSFDGINWEKHLFPIDDDYSDIDNPANVKFHTQRAIYGNGQFIVVNCRCKPNNVLVSTDGIHWAKTYINIPDLQGKIDGAAIDESFAARHFVTGAWDGKRFVCPSIMGIKTGEDVYKYYSLILTPTTTHGISVNSPMLAINGDYSWNNSWYERKISIKPRSVTNVFGTYVDEPKNAMYLTVYNSDLQSTITDNDIVRIPLKDGIPQYGDLKVLDSNVPQSLNVGRKIQKIYGNETGQVLVATLSRSHLMTIPDSSDTSLYHCVSYSVDYGNTWQPLWLPETFGTISLSETVHFAAIIYESGRFVIALDDDVHAYYIIIKLNHDDSTDTYSFQVIKYGQFAPTFAYKTDGSGIEEYTDHYFVEGVYVNNRFVLKSGVDSIVAIGEWSSSDKTDITWTIRQLEDNIDFRNKRFNDFKYFVYNPRHNKFLASLCHDNNEYFVIYIGEFGYVHPMTNTGEDTSSWIYHIKKVNIVDLNDDYIASLAYNPCSGVVAAISAKYLYLSMDGLTFHQRINTPGINSIASSLAWISDNTYMCFDVSKLPGESTLDHITAMTYSDKYTKMEMKYADLFKVGGIYMTTNRNDHPEIGTWVLIGSMEFTNADNSGVVFIWKRIE